MDAQPYRIPAPRPDTYGEAWAHLRKRRLVRRVCVGLFVYLVTTAIIVSARAATFPVQQLVRLWPLGSWPLILVGLLAICMAIARHLVPFVCPRCGRPFFEGLFMEIGFTKQCVSCDLEIGTPTPLSEEQATTTSDVVSEDVD